MASRIRPLDPDELTAEQAELYASITGGPRAAGPQHFALTDERGALRGPFDAMLRSPAVGTAQQALGAAIRYRTHLADRAREIAILLVAAHWSSAFERESHEPIARSLGLDDGQLARLARKDVSWLDGDELLVAQATLALLDGDLTDAEWEAASTAIGVDGVYELIMLVGYYATLALQLRVLRVG